MSTSARQEILGRIRAAHTAPGGPNPLQRPSASADRKRAEVLDTFVTMTRDYKAIVEPCSAAELPAAIASALDGAGARRVGAPSALDDRWLAAFEGEAMDADDYTTADLDRLDAVVTGAAVGIADTGTIVLDHSGDQGRRALTLVPDVHVCIVRESQVVADVPTAVRALRRSVDAHRALTWIAGPSATSDIELSRVEGVHGPRTLHVILLADE